MPLGRTLDWRSFCRRHLWKNPRLHLHVGWAWEQRIGFVPTKGRTFANPTGKMQNNGLFKSAAGGKPSR